MHLIVSRHAAAVAFIRKHWGWEDAPVLGHLEFSCGHSENVPVHDLDAEVVEHCRACGAGIATKVLPANATEQDVLGKIVAGNLPLNLAALTAEVWAVEFTGQPPRGAEYGLAEMEAAGACLRAYRVEATRLPCRGCGALVPARIAAPADLEDHLCSCPERVAFQLVTRSDWNSQTTMLLDSISRHVDMSQYEGVYAYRHHADCYLASIATKRDIFEVEGPEARSPDGALRALASMLGAERVCTHGRVLRTRCSSCQEEGLESRPPAE